MNTDEENQKPSNSTDDCTTEKRKWWVNKHSKFSVGLAYRSFFSTNGILSLLSLNAIACILGLNSLLCIFSMVRIYLSVSMGWNFVLYYLHEPNLNISLDQIDLCHTFKLNSNYWIL